MEQRIIPKVNAIILDNKTRILLLKRSQSNRTFKGKWQLPGGKIEFGETVEQAIIREIQEELSCKLLNVVLTCVTTCQIEINDVQAHLVDISFKANIAGNIKLSEEHDAFEWVSLNQALTYDLFPGTKEIFEKCFK